MLKQTHWKSWKLSRMKKRQEKYPKYPKPQKGLAVVHVLFHVDVSEKDTKTKRDGKMQNVKRMCGCVCSSLPHA